MKFSIHGGSPLEGRLTYDESDYGFSFSAHSAQSLRERLGSGGVTSVLIGTLQLEVDIESRELLYAWGYFPNVRDEVAELVGAPACFPGRVYISSDHVLESGVSLEVPGKDLRVFYDPASGWISILLKESTNAEFVQIATGTVLGIDAGDLVGVWLDPVFVGSQ